MTSGRSRSASSVCARTQPDYGTPEAAGAYLLTVCAPERASSPIALLPGRTYTIGRRSSSYVRLDYPQVSQEHAVVYGGDPPEIVDSGSRNGTVLKGQRLVPGRRYPLEHESVISIGGVYLLVHRPPGESVPPATANLPESSGLHSLGTVPRAGELPLDCTSATGGMIVHSAKLREVYTIATQVAASDVSVLLLGETGVGKEVVARAIHEHSSRRSARLFAVNCAAIPEALVESELFGYKRGAFSGAVNSKPGLFEAAHGSTLFLDEIGELPRTVQAKLLRVLETGEVARLGSVRSTRVDVRIIAATNRDLARAIGLGQFRADLFYRLTGVTITIPPLRERPEDIPVLAEYFALQATGGELPTLTEEACRALAEHSWPGNVRELRSVIERAVLLAGGGVIGTNQLAFDPTPDSHQLLSEAAGPRSVLPAKSQFPRDAAVPRATFTAQEQPTGAIAAELATELERRERRRIHQALERAGGNQKDAAALLGISRRTLINRLERFGMPRPRKRGGESVG